MDKITTIEELKEYQKGQVVQLPDFADGQPFFARLRRPSLMKLIKTGKIPNSLIMTANRLFNGLGVDEKSDTSMSEFFEVLDALCDATFLEPTYTELQENGIELTDEQYTAIFTYTQRGVKALDNFRTKSANNGSSVNVEDVQGKAVKTSKRRG